MSSPGKATTRVRRGTTAAADAPAGRITGFGVEAGATSYHFVARTTATGGLFVAERFLALDDDAEAGRVTSEVIKAILSAHQWGRIAEAVSAEFNARLVVAGGRAGRWLKGETPLAPYFGKELALLAWAIEDDDGTLIPKAVANWRGLAPEERWWFYTTINATLTGPEHGRDKGWRKAIKVAFADNPVDLPPSALLSGEADLKRRAAAKPAKPTKDPDQGRLRLFEDPAEYRP